MGDPLLLTAERNAAEKIRSRRGVTPKNAQEMVVGVIGENGQNVQRLVVEGLRHGKDPVQSQLLLMVAKSAVAKIQSRRSVTPKNAQGTADGLIGENGLSAKACGGGMMTRKRSCTKPAPAYGGKKCSGKDTESEKCNTEKCPEKKSRGGV